MTDYILIGIWGFVWTSLLITEGEVFSFVGDWLEKLNDTKYFHHVIKKVVGCGNCHSGQVAAWYSLYLLLNGGNIFWYAAMIAVSIGTAHFLNRINNFLKVENACKI